MNASGPNIEVHNLHKRFGQVSAVEDITFEVGKGQIMGFLGPNGAGKSTTMRILCGIIPATSGVARICGISVANHPNEVKRRIGYMPENNPQPDDMRVVEYLRYRGHLKEIPGRKLKQRVETVMELCDLRRRARRRVIGTLSKGYRQRVGIADAILAEPDVIVMDEPTIGLDPHQILAVRDLIDSFRGEMTVILSSHILAEIEVSCDCVIIINNGRLVATGSPVNLRTEFIHNTIYDLQLQGDLAALDPLLKSIHPDLTWAPSSDPDESGFYSLTIEVPQIENIGEEILLLLQRHAEYRVRALHAVEPSLEDIFLAATKRSWNESMPEKAVNPQATEPARPPVPHPTPPDRPG